MMPRVEIVCVETGVVVVEVSYECFRKFGITCIGYYARFVGE